MVNYKSAVWLLALTLFCNIVSASKVDTVLTRSTAMKKDIKAVVITPDSYNKSKQYPVVYLLHGYSGSYANWPKAAAVRESADRLDQIIVCADGGFGSWYWDSPVDPSFKYETYVSQELVAWVDAQYSTIKNPKGRAIAGLSMGGHGALYLAIKHPDVFGATGSMSGGVDIRPFPNNWDMAKRLGKYAEAPDLWEKNTVINMLHLIQPKTLSIIVDCGTEDFFYEVNQELHRQLSYRNIPHDYITRPGGHTCPYWENAVKYQLLFFHNFFSGKN
ncbi:alpha/beta hydrolase-fold protein [Niabella yanshanensis]|uniref:Alpha/beta hydrolase-fold protein n=1 Tax=Niabella yanshanensis TaxID=577386 RepID=A0ABZ0W8Y5_9BACT|nr:alpha/beta hydrolase-fold protein [Niabella yanshanensis]WQD38455.1 alpha/beta hydrolase-fold protein [Niabella yanshanensis]